MTSGGGLGFCSWPRYDGNGLLIKRAFFLGVGGARYWGGWAPVPSRVRVCASGVWRATALSVFGGDPGPAPSGMCCPVRTSI